MDEFRAFNRQTARAEIISAALAKDWTTELDWPSIRSEYLRGIPLNIIYSELFEANNIPVQYPGFWKRAQKHIAMTEATMVRIFMPAERTEYEMLRAYHSSKDEK